MNKSRLVILFLIFSLLVSFPLFAEDFNSSIKAVRKAYQAGENLKAFKQLRKSIFSLLDKMPLTVLDAELVVDQSSYVPKGSNVYSSGESIYIVCQLVGYKIKKENNLNYINIATDSSVLNEEGKVLTSQKNFGSFDLVSPFPNSEFKLDLNYTLNAPPGKYIIKTDIRDLNSDKATEITKTVMIE